MLYVASGQNFPDALAGAALAGSQGAPLLQVRSNGIPTATVQALTELRPQRIVVLGGTASVNATVADNLRAYYRSAPESRVMRRRTTSTRSGATTSRRPPAPRSPALQPQPSFVLGGGCR